MRDYPDYIQVKCGQRVADFERADFGHGDPWWDNDELAVRLHYEADSQSHDVWCVHLRGNPDGVVGPMCGTPQQAIWGLTEACRAIYADVSGFLNKTGQQGGADE